MHSAAEQEGPPVQGPGCGFALWWALASALGALVGLGLNAGAALLLAATPLLAFRPLREQGHRVLAGVGVMSGTVSAISLTLSTTNLPAGLFQRIGLTATHVWIATSALAIACGTLRPKPSPAPHGA